MAGNRFGSGFGQLIGNKVTQLTTMLRKPYLSYRSRVLLDLGIFKNETTTQQYFNMLKSIGIQKDQVRFAWLGEAAAKTRTSGIYTYFSKLYTSHFAKAVYGSELVTNGGFDASVSSWSAAYGVLAWSNGKALLTCDNLSNATRIIQSVPTVIGRKYRVKCTVENISGSGSNQFILVAEPYNTGVVPQGTLSMDFIATTATTELRAQNQNFSLDESFTVDDFSCVEVLIDGLPTDAVQATEANQPFLCGNIAPNEKVGMKNPTGGVRSMTHPVIHFGVTDEFSITLICNLDRINSSTYTIFGNDGVLNSFFGFTNANDFVCYPLMSSRDDNSAIKFFGKCGILTLTKSLSNTKLYINGVEIASDDYNSYAFALNNFLSYGATHQVEGTVNTYSIKSIALTPTQITAEYNFLRNLYPEIPSVTIGSQTWATSNCEMVATPMGNVIANVTDNGNVEKIQNGGFDSNIIWAYGGDGWVINGGVATHSGSLEGYILQGVTLPNKWYKLTFTITSYTSGSVKAYVSGTDGTYRSALGTYTEYHYSGVNGNVLLYTGNGAGSFNGSVDDVSVQEIGWSGSQELYDGVYAQTSGTAEQKTYAAVKAAAMWCYYNNDATIGAVYGKLYNWFAAKLLQMDIDYYNAANPTTPWGWKVPANADFATLSTTLGGSNVAGGKMKKEGLTYWNSPNTGADNSSGFSAISAGYRSESSFNSIGSTCIFKTDTSVTAHLNTPDTIFGIVDLYSIVWGSSLRLLKS